MGVDDFDARLASPDGGIGVHINPFLDGEVADERAQADVSRLLAYTSPARGHLYPVVPILAELGGRGHETVLYGLSP